MESCSTKAEKIAAFRNRRRDQLLYSFILYSLPFFITCFIFFYPLCFSTIRILLLSLPQNISSYLNVKFFFFIGNLIILVIIRDSTLTKSSCSSPAPDLYHDYIARSRNHEVESHKVYHASMLSTNDNEKGDGVDNSFDQERKRKIILSVRMQHQEKKDNIKETVGEKEGQLCIPHEELNKRVEAFIARVNRQRLLEAKLVDQSRC